MFEFSLDEHLSDLEDEFNKYDGSYNPMLSEQGTEILFSFRNFTDPRHVYLQMELSVNVPQMTVIVRIIKGEHTRERFKLVTEDSGVFGLLMTMISTKRKELNQ